MNRLNLAFVLALAASALDAWADPFFTYVDSAGRSYRTDLFPTGSLTPRDGVLPREGPFSYFSEGLLLDTLDLAEYHMRPREEKVKILYGRLLRVSSHKAARRLDLDPDSVRAALDGDTVFQVGLMSAYGRAQKRKSAGILSLTAGIGGMYILAIIGPHLFGDGCQALHCEGPSSTVPALGALALGGGMGLYLLSPSRQQRETDRELERRVKRETPGREAPGREAPLGFSVSMRF